MKRKLEKAHDDLTITPLYLSTLQSKNNLELLDEIDKMISRPTNEIDMDFVDACLDILQERAPVMIDYNPMTAWRELQHKYQHLFIDDDEKPSE